LKTDLLSTNNSFGSNPNANQLKLRTYYMGHPFCIIFVILSRNFLKSVAKNCF